MVEQKEPRLWLNKSEVTRMLGVDHAVVDQLIASGHLPCLDLGHTPTGRRRLRIRRDLVEQWIDDATEK